MPKHLQEAEIKRDLWSRAFQARGIKPDSNGYWPSDKPCWNLLPDVPLEQVRADYLRGSGKEWDTKFRAVHSSAALAANSFGRWKTTMDILSLLGYRGFRSLELERQLPTGLGGTPPKLDAVLESKEAVIGVESKFLEPLRPKTPKFVASYDSPDLPFDKPWRALYQAAKKWGLQHFDVAQIVKHYLGLRRSFIDGRQIVLLYVYWEPVDASRYTEYVTHKEEVDKVSQLVAGSQVRFVAKSYLELWREWLDVPALRPHALNLYRWYSFRISWENRERRSVESGFWVSESCGKL